jgi:hypothetical protein
VSAIASCASQVPLVNMGSAATQTRQLATIKQEKA